MASEFLGKGLKFPVGTDSRGALVMSEHEEDIREAIRIILATAKGERVMRPQFGCGIHDYQFEAISTSVLGLMESSVRDALIRWEPRIELVSVRALTEQIAEGKIIISVEYRVRTTNNQFNLVWPFYLTEGK